MDALDAIRTTGSVRDFTDEPVDDATVHAILDDARFAPSGGNRQAWRVAIVKDAELRRQLGGVMRPVWDDYVAVAATGNTPFAAVPGAAAAPASASAPARSAPNGLIDGIETAPVVLVIAADLAQVAMMDKDLGYRPPIVGGASLYPFCWNVLLAARGRGLGGVLTTFLARAEAEAAPLLGLPPTYAIAAVLFLGHPVHQPTKLKRNPVSSFATLDRFDGPPFTGGAA